MRVFRELAIAAAMVLLAGLLAVGVARLKNPKTGAPAHPQASATILAAGIVPWLPINPTPMPSSPPEQRQMSIESAAVTISGTVTEVRPLLLPASLPAGARAHVTAQSSGFTVEYRGDTANVALIIASPNLGLPPSNVSQRTFRGVPARYEANDPQHPQAGQFLIWTEPGVSPANPRGVPYFLKVGGLSTDQFWQVANSIGPIPAMPRLCQATELHGAFNGGQGATGHMISGLVVTNHSSTACVVQGYPRIQLLTATGSVIDSPQHDGSPMGPANPVPVLLAASQSDPAEQRGQLGLGRPGNAIVNFEWGYCPGPQPTVGRLVLTLPAGQGTLTIPVGSGMRSLSSSRCDSPEQGHGLLVGPFQLIPEPQTESGPRLQATLNLPSHAVAGQPLRYTVTLTNTSAAPVVLDPCPSYVEILGQKVAMARYQLNCAAARAIVAGDSLTFALQVDVPISVPPGEQRLSWTLEPHFLVYANGMVTISRG